MIQHDLLAKNSWIIGRADDCDLIVSGSTVSSHHCRLLRQKDGFMIEDLRSRNGTFVDGNRIVPDQPVPVTWGARVTLGTVAMPWPDLPDSSHGTVVLPASAKSAASTRITIGRDPASDVCVDLPIVSWHHAVISRDNGQYILEDCNSLNGTSVGTLAHRIQRTILDPADDIFLGSYKVPARRLLGVGRPVQVGDAASEKVSFPGNKSSLLIGRDPAADVSLPYPMVSWHHARLTREPNGIMVEDLSSRNGTYVDGVGISGKVLIRPGQEIGLGSFRFQLLEDGGFARREYYGNVTIEAREVSVFDPAGRRCLLRPVSFTVFPSEFVAVMGPAGAGKTTLLKALNGYSRPAEGEVLFNGTNLYRYYDRFRQQMGYVPQDDIMHPQLTVREAIRFSAKLRTDLTDNEIEERTVQILTDLDILDRIDTIIGSPERKLLSGGQRKRVNLALELITDTPVLFLDEPTSGLSSYDAESVIQLLRDLARSGKTVITTIHQPSLQVYRMFDDLIMICRDNDARYRQFAADHSPGAMIYFGPAFPDSLQFFNPDAAANKEDLSPEMLFSGMNRAPEGKRTPFWQQRYAESSYYKEFVSDRAGRQPPSAQSETSQEHTRRRFQLSQWTALVRRSLTVRIRDRAQTAILLVQAPFLALLLCMVVAPLRTTDPSLPAKLVIACFLMSIAAIWFGCNNAARDIVGEWTVYRRERMVTLKLLPYVFSKLAVLLALCIFQCGCMLGIVYPVCGLHGSLILEFTALLILSLIGAGLGLTVSASSRTTESAIALLPVVLLPMIALGGGMRPVYQLPRVGRIASVVIPTRWELEASLLEEAQGKTWSRFTPPAPLSPVSSFRVMQGSRPAGAVPPSSDCRWDLASAAFPACVVEVADNSGTQLHPVLTANDPDALHSARVLHDRHRYSESLAILALMFGLSVVAVLLSLRLRDDEPQ